MTIEARAPATGRSRLTARNIIVAFVVFAGTLFCRGNSALRSEVPRLPTFAFHGIETRSVLEVPPSEMRSLIPNSYRLRPDRRFLGAVAEAHHLMSGLPSELVTATLQDTTWTIEYRGERVGALPELASFEDGRSMLAAWAARLLQRYPLNPGGPLAAGDLAEARGLVARPDPVDVVFGLKTVNEGWSRAHRPELLLLAAHGLTQLAVQVPTFEVLGDPITARALATSVLAQSAGPSDSASSDLVLLAAQLGYTVESAHEAAKLPLRDPVRLYVQRDTAALRTAPGSLARFLYLAELAREGDEQAWSRWQDNLPESEEVTSGVLGRSLGFVDFGPDGSVAPRVPEQLYSELETLAGIKDPVVTIMRTAWRKITGTWWTDVLQGGILGGGDHRGRKLAQFEEQLGGVAPRFKGPFMDGDLTRLYFRAQLHQAFERSCIHLVDGLSSIERSVAFASEFDSPPPGLWTETTGWCAHHAGAANGQTPLATSLADMRDVASMSNEAFGRTYDDVTTDRKVREKPALEGIKELDIARAAFSRFDSRPHALYRAGDVADDVLFDIPLEERYYERLIALAGVDYPYTAVWLAWHLGDKRRLEALANDPQVERGARFSALKSLGRIANDSAAVRDDFLRLIAEDPDDWSVRGDYIVDILQPAKRFEDAALVAHEWLDTHPDDRSFDYIFAVTALARQYQSMGRLREAWNLISPLVETYQAGAMSRAAQVALQLGKTAVADSIARLVVKRYPTSAQPRATLAAVRWVLNDDAGAARALADPAYVLSSEDWTETIAPEFVRAFGRRPVAPALIAYRALATAGAKPTNLSTLQRAATDSGRHELALALDKELVDHGNPRVTYLTFYRHLRSTHGEPAAFEWLVARWPPPQPQLQWWDIYRAQLFDLLWTLTTQPDVSSEGSSLWLLRALGELQQSAPRPDRRRQLLAHYRAATGGGPYDISGRYLVGLESEATMIQLASSPKRRVEYSYCLGIKALSERRYRDASDWLRVTVETRQTHDGEFVLAKEMLNRWATSGKMLDSAASAAISR